MFHTDNIGRSIENWIKADESKLKVSECIDGSGQVICAELPESAWPFLESFSQLRNRTVFSKVFVNSILDGNHTWETLIASFHSSAADYDAISNKFCEGMFLRCLSECKSI